MPRARPDCGNPLLRDWMAEWMEEAKNMQMKSYFTYKKAYDSLCACPTPFAHPSESQQLNGIGPKLAIRLEKKMLEYCEENGLPPPRRQSRGKRRTLNETASNSADEPSTNKRARGPPRPYIPRFRSGSYAILLTLLDMKDDGQVAATKPEIIRQGQSYCDASLDLAEPGSNYTAWSGIKILMEKGYVWKNGSPARFSLTETGEAMAEQLRAASHDESSQPRRPTASTSGPPPVDLSLYVSDPDAFRRERGITTPTTSTTPDVDLSLYVSDPAAFLRERTSSTPTTAAPTSTTPDVDLSLYVLDPEAYRRERATSTRTPASAAASTSTTLDVDLSLYVLDPDAYRRERTASNPPRSTNTATTSYSNLDDDDEPTIDLSLGDPVTYRSKLTSTPMSRHTSNHRASQPRQDTTASKSYTEPTGDFEVITLLSPTPSPPNSPVQPTTSLNSSQRQEPSDPFEYTYLDTSDDPVRHMAQAAVEVDSKRGCLLYKIRYGENQKQHPMVHRLVSVDHDTCTAYFPEVDADVVCPGLPARRLLPLHHEESLDDFWPDLSLSSQPSQRPISAPSSQQYIDPSSQCSQNNRSEPATAPPTNTQPLDIPAMVSMAKQQGPVWQPAEYTIVMILDNREVKMKTNREYIQDKLIEKGVAVEKRALDVGDVLWVAKHVETKLEMYLDIVLERKRMDDLVSSVKDGRFHEQKYRLKQSASRKVFYVVEEYNKEAAVKFGTQAIQTAMSCVQAVDQFYLKRTGNLDETIDYLVRLTKMIGNLYKDTPLQEIPIHLINRTNYMALKKGLTDDEAAQHTTPVPHHVIPYTIFNQLNSKSGSSTLQDLYTKMLMTIRGVNAEKAQALIRVYPTPYHLLKAMDQAQGTDGKQLAVHATKTGISRRRWGSAISERLWEVWGKRQ